MADDTTTNRFETLLSEFLDGDLDDDRRREFIGLLKSEPGFTDELVDQLTMDARLTQFESESHNAERFADTLAATIAAETDGHDFIDRVIQRAESDVLSEKSHTSSATRWRRRLGTTAVALAMLAIGWAIGNSTDEVTPEGGEIIQQSDDRQGISEPTDTGVAVLAHAADVIWSGESPPQIGDILSPGSLQLHSGVLKLEFYSGARLVVEGPADLELVTAYQAICRRGRVRAIVPPAARGFTVVSPQFELVDLGTEFGLSVGPDGDSKVLVFDGEVELYPPDGTRVAASARKLLGGDGLAWDASGEKPLQPTGQMAFPSFEEIEHRKDQASKQRIERWREWNEQLADDPRVAFHFDFESEGSELLDRGPNAADGAIIGAERVSGRWHDKGALEFKRPSDRVRLDLPGRFDALTLSAWIRMDALPSRSQSLLLTDGYEVGKVHWQINGKGTLRLGVRIPVEDDRGTYRASGYGLNTQFIPRRLGTWSFVCSVYDREAGTVRQFYNGREVSSEPMIFDQALEIGLADIGNWTEALGNTRRFVRNFIGRIDELTVWNTALSGDEIRGIYGKTKP